VQAARSPNPARFDNRETAPQTILLFLNCLDYGIWLGLSRTPTELYQQHARRRVSAREDQFSEIPIFGN
jgi:hypothetical protein